MGQVKLLVEAELSWDDCVANATVLTTGLVLLGLGFRV